jgi:hypothetical protein
VTSQAGLARAPRWSIHVVAVGLAIGYLLWAPHTADLAAQTARAELFRRSGYVPFWAGWYAGIPTASYSLTTPPLLGWLDPVRLGALTIVATSLVAVPLLRHAVRPRAGALVLVLAAGFDVASGRTTFAVGALVALAALLAAERRRVAVAVLLAAVATATSPVAGFLLLVVLAALAVADPARRRVALGMATGVVVVLGLLGWLARGDGPGYEPLTRTSFVMAAATALVVVLAPVGRRVRIAAALTIAMLIAVYFVHSPIGANGTRLAVLVAAPAVVAAARTRSEVVLVALVVLASLLPLAQLRNDLTASRHDDSSRAFVAPVAALLAHDPVARAHRVEVVDTATHWPSTYLLPDVALARGWERQVDESRNPMFYGRAALTAASYRRFLDANAVGVVAVPRGVPLDYGARREAALVSGGLPYLHERWSNAHWQVYDVDRPTPVVAPPAAAGDISDTGLRLSVSSAGRYAVRIRWSPYLVVTGGRVARSPNGDVTVTTSRPGTYLLHAVWRAP